MRKYHLFVVILAVSLGNLWGQTEEPTEKEVITENLEEVIVTKKKASVQKSYFKPQNVVTISSDELLKAACCNLSESFETNPSIDVNFSDALTGTKQIRMLGLSSPYILISQENIPTVRGAAQAYGLTFTPGPWIESIQITKGAGSVVNGFESIAGQINTELYKPLTASSLFFNTYASVNGRYELNAHFNHRLNDKWSAGFYLHGNQRRLNTDMNDDGFLDMPRGEQLNSMARLQYTNAKKGWVGFLTLRYLNDTKLAGEIESSEQMKSTWTSTIDTQRFDATLKTGYIFPLRTYQSIGMQAAYSAHTQSSVFGPSNYSIDQESFYGTLLLNSIFSNTMNTFKTGVSLQYDRYDENVNTIDYQRIDRSTGLFFEYTYNDIETLSFVVGARLDTHNNLGTFITPRLNLRVTPWKGSAFRMAAGQGRRASSFFAENQPLFFSQRSIEIMQSSGAFYGLGPERATNYGLSFLQGFSLFSRQGDIAIDFYRTDFREQVVVDWETPGAIKFYNLEGKSYAENLQLELNYSFTDQFAMRSALKTYSVQTDYESGRLDKPLTPSNRFFLNLDYRTKPNSKNQQWRTDLTYHFIGEQRLPDNKRDGVGYRAPSYGLMNAQITKVFSEGFEVYLGGENLANFKQENPIVDAQNPFGPDFDASLIYAPIFGRMAYIGMRWRPEIK